jgi:hypothetical protein
MFENGVTKMRSFEMRIFYVALFAYSTKRQERKEGVKLMKKYEKYLNPRTAPIH